MTTLTWIVVSGLLMGAIALIGSTTLLLRTETLERIITPLVAFAAGSLLGGALFHMLPRLRAVDSPCRMPRSGSSPDSRCF